jgi:hypothetical protein
VVSLRPAHLFGTVAPLRRCPLHVSRLWGFSTRTKLLNPFCIDSPTIFRPPSHAFASMVP